MYYHSIILIFFLFITCCSKAEVSNNKKTINNSKNHLSVDDECADYVALWSASDIAKELGIDKKWAFLNYTVDIWDIPPSDSRPGDIVGELKVQSYARIIDRTDNEYLVESPMTKVHGWLDKAHVKSITRKNIRTNKLCD